MHMVAVGFLTAVHYWVLFCLAFIVFCRYVFLNAVLRTWKYISAMSLVTSVL